MNEMKKPQTPMMEQYFRIKKEHKDALLFFRLGDFYEMFYEDAAVASSVLEITLTSRQKVPMCGVPHHAADTYLAKLLKNGFKVAICEQVEDSKQACGVVKRDVVKVLTPGTALEIDLGGENESSYIASLYIQDNNWGLALIDLAAGEIKTSQCEGGNSRELADELFKFSPREITYSQEQSPFVEDLFEKNEILPMLQSPQDDWIFEFSQAKNYLLDHFEVKSLAGFDLTDKSLAVSAAGALLFYLKALRKDSLTIVKKLSYIQSSSHMVMDAVTIKNLELIKNLRDGRRGGSLLDIIDYTVNSMGSRLLKSWLLHPLLDEKKIKIRLDTVEELLLLPIERHELRDSLKEIFDLERLTGKISLSVAHPRDLIALKKSLVPLPRIKALLTPFKAEKLKITYRKWDNAEDILKWIEGSIRDEPAFQLTEGGIIRDGCNAELDELRQISRSGKSFITALEKQERERTGITSLKIRYNKVFGYYIDVTKPNLHLIPEDYIRKQTLVNSERFITAELKEYEDKVLRAEERIGQLEYELFIELREKISKETSRLQRIALAVAALDVYTSMAELAALRDYNRPLVDTDDKIDIKAGRHPVIEIMNEDPFIPNDTYLDRKEDQIQIITGPNMGGKSTFLRQVALVVILAQMGSFVPADMAEIGLVDRIFTRIGAMDFISVGQSTFMVEMLETANILNNATAKSLILLDEVGRGTSTFDGLSLAWAIAEYLHEQESVRAKTLFATHYHELTELALTLNRIKNYHVTVKEQKGEITFLRKIVAGPSDQSYGIHVAKLAGLPGSVLARSREVLFNLEKKELDDIGRPKISYRASNKIDRSQILLFEEEREQAVLSELKEKIKTLDLNSITPLQALNILEELKQKL